MLGWVASSNRAAHRRFVHPNWVGEVRSFDVRGVVSSLKARGAVRASRRQGTAFAEALMPKCVV